MKESNSSSEYYIKHILSTEWIPAKYISDNGKHIELLIEDTDSISFEEDDKIIYSVKSKNKNCTFNTVISDIDFPTYDKIAITIEKPFERRCYSRYNVNLLATLQHDNDVQDCVVVDISKKGFKIITNTKLSVNDSINLSISLGGNQFIHSTCNVIHKSLNVNYLNNTKFVYGLKIASISFEDKTLLNDFVITLKEYPAKL